MKKLLWGIIPVVLVAIGALTYKFQLIPAGTRPDQIREEAIELTTFMDVRKAKTSHWPTPEEIDEKLRPSGLKWGTGKDVSEWCKDCLIDMEGFRIVVYGNLDKDPAVEAWIIMNGSEPQKVSSDAD